MRDRSAAFSRCLLALASCLAASTAAGVPPPWQRTEARAPCARFDTLRSAYFGDLHVHTRYSADAYIYGTRVGPRDAYAFARGDQIPLADANEEQTRAARLDRTLDFTAVTDHAEFFGETYLCSTPGTPVYDIEDCQLLRRAEPNGEGQFQTTVRWLFPAGVPDPPPSLPFCAEFGVDCDAAAVGVWQDIQAAAEEAYDRSAACRFTSFVGYEHTASPVGRHLHRNVIFRNEHVPPFAASQLETAALGIPQGIWSAIEAGCLGAQTGCDAILIPHNSNLSGGEQWHDPADAAEAARRQRLEPLVEIHQQKGNSECRFDRLAGRGAGTADELCTFEQLLIMREPAVIGQVPIADYPRRNLVRNTLKEGLRLEDRLGVNPFQLGFVGGTDTHNGTAGNTDEIGWEGGAGNNDASAALQIGTELRTNPGGLTVAWAEENSRDALFEALRRRETYATSGTRPLVRFFGGDLAEVRCDAPDLVRSAYARGAPMGGELGAVRGERSPRFVVAALKDPGTPAQPGSDLAQIQIVKGWVDGRGQTHERVFDVAGHRNRRARVDPATCRAIAAGSPELCRVWHDPTFRSRQRAFYYARVLESPTCRWSTHVCKAAGVDPFAPDCATHAAAAGSAFADCCRGTADDPFLSPIVQERAWTSPIWYRPEGLRRVNVTLTPASGELRIALDLGRLPRGLELTRIDVAVTIADDDEVYRVTLPGGSWRRRGRRFLLEDPGGAAGGGLTRAVLTLGEGRTARLRLEALTDLAHADPTDHMVTVRVQAGAYDEASTRLWTWTGERLEGR